MRPCLKLASAVAAVASLALVGCADQPTATMSADDGVVPVALDAEQRAEIRRELLLAGEQSRIALQRRPERDDLIQKLETLAARLDANDGRSFERALAVARAALRRYGEITTDDLATLPELEALAMMLDEVAARSTRAKSAAERHLSEEHRP